MALAFVLTSKLAKLNAKDKAELRIDVSSPSRFVGSRWLQTSGG